MSFEIPRLRMFAGPNGSGKSTIKDLHINNHQFLYVKAIKNNKKALFNIVLLPHINYKMYLYYVDNFIHFISTQKI